MSMATKAIIGFFCLFFISLGASKLKEEILAGEDDHAEIYRLRKDVRGVRNLLIIANGLLGALVAALIF